MLSKATYLYYNCIVVYSILYNAYVSNANTTTDISSIRLKCKELRDRDENIGLLTYLNNLEQLYGSLHLDESLPSLYNFKVS